MNDENNNELKINVHSAIFAQRKQTFGLLAETVAVLDELKCHLFSEQEPYGFFLQI